MVKKDLTWAQNESFQVLSQIEVYVYNFLHLVKQHKGFVFLLCHITFRVNLHSVMNRVSRNLLKQAQYLKIK